MGPADDAGTGELEVCAPWASLRAGADAGQAAGSCGAGEAPACARAPSDGIGQPAGQKHIYAALDLGTNNCRLLIARAATTGYSQDGFRVIDLFSRIVRLGEGLTRTGELSAAAIERTIRALEICRDKMCARGVTRARLIATEACRAARNSAEFLSKVRNATGLELEIVDRETEARLAVTGSVSLVDSAAESAVLFDIGGGSSELAWIARAAPGGSSLTELALDGRIRFWVSLKLGVVTLAEEFGGFEVSGEIFEAMVDYVVPELSNFVAKVNGEQRCHHFHLLGTSGTVTTIAGVFLGLVRYDRRRVDGLWMSRCQVDQAVASLRNMSYAERAANGCIGHTRADLVLAGCAILEAIRRAFPAERVRIADRGLRDGILIELMKADGNAARGEH